MGERRSIATEAEVNAALEELDLRPHRVPASEWPADLSSLDVSGLYSWWTDGDGAHALSEGLGAALGAGRIYAGQTGATKWPSGTVGSATLRSRIGSNHLRGSVRGSTFRLTLAAALRDPLDLAVEGSKKLAPESEAKLSTWMGDHLRVGVHAFPERDALSDLESKVLSALDPPLNLEGRPSTPLRVRLSGLRTILSLAPPNGTRPSSG